MKNKIAALKAKLSGGVAPAMSTPLNADGYSVNVDVVPQLVEFLLSRGARGVFAGGTTGEGIMLDLDQRKILHEVAITAVRDSSHDGIAIVHTGTNNTRDTIELAKHAEAHGADMIVTIAPYFLKMADADLLSYFAEVAAVTPNIPFMVYDIPQYAINGVSPQLLKDMSENIPNFCGLKCSRPDAQIIRRLIDAAGPDLIMLLGNEAISIGTLSMGATGMISGLSTAIPEPFVALTAAVADQRMDDARTAFRAINALLGLMPADKRIGGIKAILNERGVQVGNTLAPRPMYTGLPLWPAMEAVLAKM